MGVGEAKLFQCVTDDKAQHGLAVEADESGGQPREGEIVRVVLNFVEPTTRTVLTPSS